MADLPSGGGGGAVDLPGGGVTMDREEFCRQVCYAVPRATPGEWEEMKAELMGHMEDRMDYLAARGRGPAEAEAEAVRRMGDPEEVGRALNRQLSQVWLVIRMAATMGAAAMAVIVVLSLWTAAERVLKEETMAAYTEAIHSPFYEWEYYGHPKEEYLAGMYYIWTDCDEKERLGDDVLWLYGMEDCSRPGGARRGYLDIMTYKAQGPAWAALLPGNVRAVDDRGREVEVTPGGINFYNEDYAYARSGEYYFEAQPDAKALTVTFSRYGETATFQVSLGGEEAGS